jgi:hypothetical protein
MIQYGEDIIQHSHLINYTQKKLVRIIKIKNNTKVHTSKDLSDAFPIQNGIKQGEDALSSLLFNFALEYAIRKV